MSDLRLMAAAQTLKDVSPHLRHGDARNKLVACLRCVEEAEAILGDVLDSSDGRTMFR